MDKIIESIAQLMVDLGASVVVPIIMIILGIIFGQKPGRAIRSGLIIAIGFVGIGLTVGMLGDAIGPVSQALVQRAGIRLDAVDVGWPAAAAISFSTPVGLLIIPIGIVINIILLILGLTKTLDVDIWDFWHMAFLGAVVMFITKNFAYGLIAASIGVVFALFLADWSAGYLKKFFHMPGISIPHLQSAGYMMLAVPIAMLLKKIPVLGRTKLNPDYIREKLGLFGEPVIMGFIIAMIIGIPAGVGFVPLMQFGVQISAAMLLIPRMVGILMEGLTPLADSASDFMQKRFKNREFYIGLDSAVLVGHPTTIAVGLLLVPTEIVLALIIPGNHVLPFVDLADGVFVAALLTPLVGGDVLLTWILSALTMGFGLYFGTVLSPAITAAAQQAQWAFPNGVSTITCMSDGAIGIIYGIYELFNWNGIGAIIICIVALIGLYFVKEHWPLGEKLLKVSDEDEN